MNNMIKVLALMSATFLPLSALADEEKAVKTEQKVVQKNEKCMKSENEELKEMQAKLDHIIQQIEEIRANQKRAFTRMFE
jgi:peptidoglycan hydrolase CwlO-like protein